MKKRSPVIILLILFISNITFAQKVEVQSAYRYMNLGQLDDALKSINNATADESTKDMAKTWKYRGDIMMAIYNSPSDKGLVFDPLGEAYKSYVKAHQLDEKKEYQGDLVNIFLGLAHTYYNQGVEPYNKQQFSLAYKNFSKVIDINKILNSDFKKELGMVINGDTVNFYRAFSAFKAEKLDDAKMIFKFLIDSTKYRDPAVYNLLGNIYLTQKDTTTALTTVKKGREAYPNDNNLLITQLNIYLATHHYKDAISILNEAIAKAPDSSRLYYALGTAYDNVNDTTNAINAYKKAVSLKPDYFEAYFGIGAEYFNSAVLINKTMNDLGTSVAETKKYDVLKPQRDALFAKAIPYLEKARSINGKDMETLNALEKIYGIMNQTDKMAEIKKAISDAGGK